MNLEKYVAIAGLPGVHKLIASRSNGVIIEDKVENRNRFVPVRANQFTPLATIAVYTNTEEGTIPLGDVWQRMFDATATTPVVPQTSKSEEFRTYFDTVLPEHDHDQVHINDIKKCLKWYSFMLDKGMLQEAMDATKKAAEAAVVTEETAK
jgi:hypothetical protein